MACRLTAALMALLLVLATACASPHVVRLDTGQGAPLEYRPPGTSQLVEVSEEDFEQALSRMVLEEPLVLRPARQGWLVRTSSTRPAEEGSWQHWVGKGLGGLCRPGQPREECLSLLDDVMGLSRWEKLALGLGLSFEPMRESIARALEDTMTPRFFAAAIGAGMVSWAILAANPEPVFTKAAALVAAVLLVYLGAEAFLEVVKACQELRRASEEAVTLEELEEASQRFGARVGPRVARLFILAVALVVSRGTMGGAEWVAARLPLLPSFAEASAVGAAQVGLVLEQVGQVGVVAVVEGGLAITLAPTAVAMFATGSGSQGGSVSTQGSGSNLTTTRQSGGTTYRFNTGHGFNRAHKSGIDFRSTDLTPDAVENAIMAHLKVFRASGGTLPTVRGGAVPQPYMGRVGVGGHTIEFSAVQTPGGMVSVGTYYLLP